MECRGQRAIAPARFRATCYRLQARSRKRPALGIRLNNSQRTCFAPPGRCSHGLGGGEQKHQAGRQMDLHAGCLVGYSSKLRRIRWSRAASLAFCRAAGSVSQGSLRNKLQR